MDRCRYQPKTGAGCFVWGAWFAWFFLTSWALRERFDSVDAELRALRLAVESYSGRDQ